MNAHEAPPQPVASLFTGGSHDSVPYLVVHQRLKPGNKLQSVGRGGLEFSGIAGILTPISFKESNQLYKTHPITVEKN